MADYRDPGIAPSYDREVLVNVLVYHWRTKSSGAAAAGGLISGARGLSTS